MFPERLTQRENVNGTYANSVNGRSRRKGGRETNGSRHTEWEKRRESGRSLDGGACLSIYGGKIDRLGRRSWREGKKLQGQETFKGITTRFL